MTQPPRESSAAPSAAAKPLDGLARVLRDAGLLKEVRGAEDVDVSGVSHDSRKVAEGDVFVAWPGMVVDGHDYAAAAVEAGARALICERPLELDVPRLVVADGRAAAALAAHWMEDRPGDALRLAAITGTNGKTTTAFLLRHILAARDRAAIIGTLGYVGTDGTARPETAELTTPGPVEFARRLRASVERGVQAVVFEASSHALHQRRFEGVRLDVAVFTNLSRDHLDYHPDMNAYRAAKLRLLEHLADDGTAVVNAGDSAWSTIDAPKTLAFAVGDAAPDVRVDLRAVEVESTLSGTEFTLVQGGWRYPVDLPLIGDFNVENAVAAAAAAIALGHDLSDVVARLRTVSQVPGRLERVVDGLFTVLIDFAHTPDALERVLWTLRPLVNGRLVVLFGAGGDRDVAKRPEMAAAVSRVADLVVLTSDNPRTEDPEKILDDLEAGLGDVPRIREADRRAAIRIAIGAAEPGDLVLLAGKGHERTQTIGTEKHAFDEAALVREACAARGAA